MVNFCLVLDRSARNGLPLFTTKIHFMSNRVILSGFKKLSLLTLFLLAGLSGCQKENENTLYSPENQLSKYATPSGAELVLSQAQEEAIPGALEERDNDWNHNKQPKYPFYPGDCRLILRVYKFDPNVIHGGGDPPCSGSITIRGYSQRMDSVYHPSNRLHFVPDQRSDAGIRSVQI
jgi:hypothetical protein